jgi:hypothetical protein
MRTLLSMLVLTSLFLTVSCSDAVSPAADDVVDARTGKSGSAPSIQPAYMKLGDIKGECSDVEEAMDIYTGQGAETCGLLLPAVQKVREAAARMEEETDRSGDILAKDAYKILHQAIRSFNPPANAYELKDLIVTSLEGRADPTRGNSVDLSPYGNEHDKNVEYLLWHIFNGVRIELENAGVDDRLIDAELGQLMGTIEALS